MSISISIQQIDNYGTIQLNGSIDETKNNEIKLRNEKTMKQKVRDENVEEKYKNEIKELNKKIEKITEQKQQLNELIKELRQSNEELQMLLMNKKFEHNEMKNDEFHQNHQMNEMKEFTEQKESKEMKETKIMKENEFDEFNELEDDEPIQCSNELLMAFNQMNQMSPYSNFYSQNNENINEDQNDENEMKEEILNLDKNEIELLKQWTNKQTLTVIYNQNVDGFNREKCLEIVKGKESLLIVIETIDGEIFGSYHTVLPSQFSSWCSDAHHFAFSLRNKYEIKQKFEAKSTNKYSFMISDFMEDDDEYHSTIIETGYFYTITMDEICTIQSSFTSQYMNPSKYGIDIFGKNSSRIEVKNIIFIE